MNLLIMGAPGSGKGTMSEKICDKYQIEHISTGDLLREAVKSGSEVGKKANEYMRQGLLVPDGIIHQIIVERLSNDESKKGFLMDGYPRTLAQAEDLDSILKELDIKLDCIIQLNLDFDILAKRITGRRVCKKCGAIYHISNKPSKVAGVCDICGGELYTRQDDTIESLKVRLGEYEKSTKPLLDYYSDHVKIENIQADGTPEEVFALIESVLG